MPSRTVLPSTTYQKLLKVPVTIKMINKVIPELNTSMVSSPDCITLMALKNCEILYILVDLFNICLKKFCLRDC